MPRFQNINAAGHKGGGFTLVELMVSTAVLSLLLVMLAQVSSMLGNTWSSSNGRAERRQNGRALVDFIGQELRSAALPVDRKADLAAPDLQMVLNPPMVSADYRHPSALFWQAPLASNTDKGDMAVLGYFVRWTPATGTQPPRASLCRVFINPGDTHHQIYTSLDNWITDPILDEVAKADYASGYAGLFADNAIGFWVRCLDQAGNPIVQTSGADTFNSRLAYAGKIRDVDGKWADHPYEAPVLPDSIEVSLVLLDNRSASQLTPDMASVIQATARISKGQGDLTPANQFMQILTANPSLKRIIQGMSAHSVRVYLENAP